MSASGLYQAALLDHAKHPRNFGPLPDATATGRGDNPLCGDELIVRVRERSGRVERIAFEGAGCAVCLGSASMMTVAAEGRSGEEIAALMQRVRSLLAGEMAAVSGELAALGEVARHPSRVRCAALAWVALEAALLSSNPLPP